MRRGPGARTLLRVLAFLFIGSCRADARASAGLFFLLRPSASEGLLLQSGSFLSSFLFY